MQHEHLSIDYSTFELTGGIFKVEVYKNKLLTAGNVILITE